MKRLLTLMLALVMLLALCACGDDAGGQTSATPSDTVEDNGDTTQATDSSSPSSDNDTDADTEETGYVGTWIYEKQTDKGPFKITLVINENGTATRTVGKTVTSLIWYEDADSDHGEGAIEIASEGKQGYGDDAYITEDGKLYLESSGTILDEPYDHLIFDRQ